jgi:nitroreductase
MSPRATSAGKHNGKMMKNTVLEALQFRHACKKFDANRTIPAELMADIIESAHLSPSSFGMEAWKFLVVESAEWKEKIRPACWNQPQITDCSHVMVLLACPDLTTPDSKHVKAMFSRRGLGEEAVHAYIDKYREHHKTEIDPLMSHYAWCAKQCYLALGNIMTAAAAVGVDSCPIEGFSKQELEAVLGLDTTKEQVAVVVALGYRAGEQPIRFRRPLNEVVQVL